MKICIFYSWQSEYEDDCKRFIGAAIKAAVNELNAEQTIFEYYVVRGGGGLIGSQEINVQIDNALRYEACMVVSDYTHIGQLPTKDGEGKWIKRRALPNPNVIDETARAKERVGTMQIIKVNNTYYGDYKENIDMYFDIQNERFPLGYSFHKTEKDAKPYETKAFRKLKESLKESIGECKDEFLKNQKVRFSPLVPLMDIYEEKIFKEPFLPAKKFVEIQERIATGKSFRLLALPGIGKTRMVCEAFRGLDINLYYCDCKNKNTGIIREAIGKLLESTKDKQIVVVDNCDQTAHSTLLEETYNHDTECQLITLYYNVREIDDTDVEVMRITPKETPDVVKFLLDNVEGLAETDKEAIMEIAGGFPLMVNMLIEQYAETGRIASVSKAELFNRMLNINEQNADDIEKKKVMTAFSIFKFIGLWNRHEKEGRFVANNQILTPLVDRNAENRFVRFLNVYAEFSNGYLLDKEGDMVLMRPVPLAIYLAKKWYQLQTAETISLLVSQIHALEDEGTKNMLIESLSRRVTLMADVPLAQDLVGNLLNPINSPFLSEEVVLTKLGSRLFLAFSEVNPEACAFALYQIIRKKNDSALIAIGEARRNLAWALDHLAFDRRSFKSAMLTLARFSQVETEGMLSNNTTGLFIERFPVFLPATEVPLMERLEVIEELIKEKRNKDLVRKALLMGLNVNHDYRTGGAEKQGLKSLTDYVPKTYGEVIDYFSACFKLLLSVTDNKEEEKEIGKTISSCARGYYLRGFEPFLFEAISELAPRYDYDWEEMKEALSFIVKYDAPKRKNYRVEEIEELKKKFTRDDYVYRLLHGDKDFDYEDNLSFEEELKRKINKYEAFAHELIDGRLYEEKEIMEGVMRGDCFHYNNYGVALSAYSKEKGVQKELLGIIRDLVLYQEVSRDGESLLIYFLLHIEDKELLEETYEAVLNSEKKRLLPAIYAIKAEEESRLAQLFDLLDQGELAIVDFKGYFNYRALANFDVKYVASRLLKYGPEGAGLVLTHCHNLLFGDHEIDTDYQEIGRKCLLLADIHRSQIDDHIYMNSMNNYLEKHPDEGMAWHVQELQERMFEEHNLRDNYYLGRLYRKVLKNYTVILLPRVLELLEKKNVRHSWIDLMRTSYPQEKGNEAPIYTLISEDDWFSWLDNATNHDRAYTLAMMFSYAENGRASTTMLRLIDGYWCFEIQDALGSRMHTFSWTGSGIPLYRSRIAICEDYVARLTNEEAREWFRNDIEYWEKEINEELLDNAHKRAIYD